jgi:formyltetrahydrofolate synthetase
MTFARDLAELKARLARVIVGFTPAGAPVAAIPGLPPRPAVAPIAVTDEGEIRGWT